MKSIVNATIGRPYADTNFVYIPMALNVSQDDTDDDEPPHVVQSWLEVVLTHATVAAGRERVSARLSECLDHFRPDWSPHGLAMLEAQLQTFVAKTDLSHFSANWFADPTSLTEH
jgi:hypothetical protein